MKANIIIAALLTCTASAYANLYNSIDFNRDASLDPIYGGQVIDNEFAGWGVSISGSGGAGFASVYDSTVTGGADPDLEAAFSGGNAASSYLGNVLIIQENGGISGNFGTSAPDDNAGGGVITIDFAGPADAFQFSTVDVDHNGGSGFALTLSDSVTGGSSTVQYADFINPSSVFYDSSVVYGDNFANLLPVISVDDLAIDQFDQVKFEFDGSNSVGSIAWDPAGYRSAVPEPSSAMLLGIASLAPLLRRRRR